MTIGRMRLVFERNRTHTTIKTKRIVYINRKRVENHEYSIEFYHHRRTSDGSRGKGGNKKKKNNNDTTLETRRIR